MRSVVNKGVNEKVALLVVSDFSQLNKCKEYTCQYHQSLQPNIHVKIVDGALSLNTEVMQSSREVSVVAVEAIN